MKKVLVALVYVVSLVIMTACDGSNAKKDSGKITTEDMEKQVKTGAFGRRTKEAARVAFKGIGLGIDEIEPNHGYLDVDTVKIYRGVVHQGRYEGSVVFIKKDMSETNHDELKTHVRKMYALTQKIADDKKVVYGFEMKSDTDGALAEWAVDDILAQKGILGFPRETYDWGQA